MPLSRYEQVKRYRAKYPERHRQESLRYYYRYKERINLRQKAWARNGGNLQKRYKITLEQYERLLLKQGKVCAICGEAESAKYKGLPKKLSVDHDHQTGKVRALLCGSCNRGIGYLKDNSRLALNAYKYLKKHGK